MRGFKISGFVWKGPYTRSTLTLLTLNWGAAYRAFHKLLGNFLATSRISNLRPPRTHAHQLQLNRHCSSSQLESISRQLWVSCHWVSLGHDQAIAVCGSWFNTVRVLMPFLISDLVGSVVIANFYWGSSFSYLLSDFQILKALLALIRRALVSLWAPLSLLVRPSR